MSFLDKYKPMQAPADKGGGGDVEQWPTDIPEYCKGVEVHPNEPYYSLGDGLAKGLMLVRMSTDEKSSKKIDGLDNIQATLYWLGQSQKFYAGNAAITQGLSTLKPLLERLSVQVEKNNREGIRELVDQVGEMDDSLDKTFQIETGKLLSSTAVALFPLMPKGLNRKVLNIITEPVSREEATALLQLIADNEAGKLDDDGLKNGIETLFADQLK